MGWPDVAFICLLLIYRGAILGVTAYAVFWLGYSGGWFLLAILLMPGGASKDET